jgi:enediyne biosynthesis protein E4
MLMKFVAAAAAAVCLFLLSGLLAPSSSSSAFGQASRKMSVPQVEFVDVTGAAGIKWSIRTLAPGVRNILDTMGGGGGFIDYDGDGLLDIYLVSYSQTAQAAPSVKLRDALYRNNGDGSFTDVTERAGVSNSMQGMGMAAADYDNDGWTDMYITGFGESKLYHNNGNGTFTDVTRRAAVNDKLWGASAAFFDYDNDGYLDLYVCNYLKYESDESAPCSMIEGRPYCAIERFKGTASLLFHNNRDGTFKDVSEKAGINAQTGKGLGVIALDYNNDGLMDIFQANDTSANFLFRNNGNGTFSEVALKAGVAYDPDGNARGGMGVDAEDVDQDGWLDIFVANFTDQTYAFFHNNGDETFTETTDEVGLGHTLPLSGLVSGFGARFLDYNNDGLLDLFVVNGHPFEPIQKVFPKISFAEPPLLFENTGKNFREVSQEHGAALRRNYAGRGLALGDFDNDGDADLLLMSVGDSPALLRNDGGNRQHWLGLKLFGTKSNRAGIGAKVWVTAGNVRRWKQLLGGTSYCSASDTRLLFGLGPSEKVDALEVKWPSGQTTRLQNIRANQYITIKEDAKAGTK